MDSYTKGLLKLAGFLVVALLNAVCVYYLWIWFVMPLGPPNRISLGHAAGLCLIIGLARGGGEFDTNNIEVWIRSIVNPLTVLFLGWIIATYFM